VIYTNIGCMSCHLASNANINTSHIWYRADRQFVHSRLGTAGALGALQPGLVEAAREALLILVQVLPLADACRCFVAAAAARAALQP